MGTIARATYRVASVGIFSVLGVIDAIGPCAAGPGGTVYAWIEFIERGGKVRRVGNVIAGAAIAPLVGPPAIRGLLPPQIRGTPPRPCPPTPPPPPPHPP